MGIYFKDNGIVSQRNSGVKFVRYIAVIGTFSFFHRICDVVIDKVKNGEGAWGYNGETDSYEDLMKAGIMDPTKVVRFAKMQQVWLH